MFNNSNNSDDDHFIQPRASTLIIGEAVTKAKSYQTEEDKIKLTTKMATWFKIK